MHQEKHPAITTVLSIISNFTHLRIEKNDFKICLSFITRMLTFMNCSQILTGGNSQSSPLSAVYRDVPHRHRTCSTSVLCSRWRIYHLSAYNTDKHVESILYWPPSFFKRWNICTDI